MIKVGIMGGTFDPIHIGHLIAASCAQEAADLDEVWFIPTATPPLKANAPTASEEQRLEMVRLAIESNPRFRVLDVELKRGGTSYSIDTVITLMEQYKDYSFYYIVGSDRIHDLPQWHRAEELRQLVRFIGLERPSEPLQLDLINEAWRNQIILAPMPLIDISSTALRKRVLQEQALTYYVPFEVEQFIRRCRLYE